MQSALVCLMVASAVIPPRGASPDSLLWTASRGPVRPVAFPSFAPTLRQRDLAPPPQRPKAVEFSDGYYTRATIHRYASYATVPLFVTEYLIGRSLYNQTGESESLRSWHAVTAGGIYTLFAVNTPDRMPPRMITTVTSPQMASDAIFSAWRSGITSPLGKLLR